MSWGATRQSIQRNASSSYRWSTRSKRQLKRQQIASKSTTLRPSILSSQRRVKYYHRKRDPFKIQPISNCLLSRQPLWISRNLKTRSRLLMSRITLHYFIPVLVGSNLRHLILRFCPLRSLLDNHFLYILKFPLLLLRSLSTLAYNHANHQAARLQINSSTLRNYHHFSRPSTQCWINQNYPKR